MSETIVIGPEGLSAGDLAVIRRALSRPSPAGGDGERIDRIAALEGLKAAAAAEQAREAVAFGESQLAARQTAGLPERNRALGIADQVALARRESPFHGGQFLSMATALVEEMPATLAAMTAGDCSERKAALVARETRCLMPAHRREVDALLGESLGSLSDRQAVGQARRHAYRLDPVSFVRRSAQAEADRYVSFRPAPDTMVQMSALLPLREGISVRKALEDAAASGRAAGDPRGRGQLMADTLFQRVTGKATADEVPLEIQVLLSDTTLLGGDDEPARVEGHGPIPAPIARHLVRDLPRDTKVWIRRLYGNPTTGWLTQIDSTRRCFDGTLRTALIVRDEVCRTPYCNGTIKHLDHVVPVAKGGRTSEVNGQGLCEHCNYVKDTFGWTSMPDADGGAGASVRITTPTGHTYMSRPPPLPGAPPAGGDPPTDSAPTDAVVYRWLPPVEVYYHYRHGDAA